MLPMDDRCGDLLKTIGISDEETIFNLLRRH